MASDSEHATGESIGHERRESAHEAGLEGVHLGKVHPTGKDLELHVCMGLNSCQSHDIKGTAPMAGMGHCATAIHVCHGDNACRGQGGCGYSGSDYEQAKPGNQSCSLNGSCASPINASRVFSAGPYKGKSVWKRARAIFEERMYESGVRFGPSPGDGYPDDLVPGGDIQ
jgi:hypothetical protein